ncbi:MAG: rhomboid family intramembrane serine protease [Actinomycetota bacterium]
MSGRFSLSFPGRRGPDDPWFRVGAVDVNTSLLAALLCTLSMFVWALSPSFLEPLILWPDKVLNGQVWRLFTWPIANAPDIWTLAIIAMLWYFGKELERMVGRMQFAVLLLLLAVVPGIIGALLDIPQAGIRSVEIAIFCVFAAEYPNVRFFFGVPAWVIAAVIVVIEILQLSGNRDSERIILLLVSLATAAIAGRGYGLLAEYAWIPHIPMPNSSAKPKTKRSRRQGRDFDRVVAGPWTGPSPADQHEMDRLLDKMNSVGLSDAERKRLSELGKRLRGS